MSNKDMIFAAVTMGPISANKVVAKPSRSRSQYSQLSRPTNLTLTRVKPDVI